MGILVFRQLNILYMCVYSPYAKQYIMLTVFALSILSDICCGSYPVSSFGIFLVRHHF